MHVKRNTLLLLACLVWSAAGFNILRIGLMAYPAYLTVLNTLLSVLVFAVFQYFIFGKLVKKHTARIQGYPEERHFFLKFFDGKAFAIMAVMMTGGIGGPPFCWPGCCSAETSPRRSWEPEPYHLKISTRGWYCGAVPAPCAFAPGQLACSARFPVYS